MSAPYRRPAAPRRHARVPIVALALVVVASAFSLAGPDDVLAGKGSRREQLRFMWAMAGQESGWDYFARNRSSGAFGKYQIMPFNWPNWAEKYLGDRHADQTPWNQEKVAYGKQRDLYQWLGSWKRVAYWWLTGKSDKNEKRWSAYARRYVTNIMRMRKRAPASGAAMPPRIISLARRGDWRRSASAQKLRLSAAGSVWPARGRVSDGQVLRIRGAKMSKGGHRWLRVVTADGRLGWLKQTATLPTRRPEGAARWHDVDDTGRPLARADRTMVRPRPR